MKPVVTHPGSGSPIGGPRSDDGWERGDSMEWLMTTTQVQIRWSGSRRRRAFTIVELVIVVLIIAILAAIVIPRFSSASSVAGSSALLQDLRYIRQQIQVYQAQHFGVAPGYSGGDPDSTPSEADFIAQMTNPTSADGTVGSSSSQTFRFGPYMAEMPINPINASSAVMVIANGSPLPPAPTGPSVYGWLYKPETLEFKPYVAGQDENGRAYYDY